MVHDRIKSNRELVRGCGGCGRRVCAEEGLACVCCAHSNPHVPNEMVALRAVLPCPLRRRVCPPPPPWCASDATSQPNPVAAIDRSNRPHTLQTHLQSQQRRRRSMCGRRWGAAGKGDGGLLDRWLASSRVDRGDRGDGKGGAPHAHMHTASLQAGSEGHCGRQRRWWWWSLLLDDRERSIDRSEPAFPQAERRHDRRERRRGRGRQRGGCRAAAAAAAVSGAGG